MDIEDPAFKRQLERQFFCPVCTEEEIDRLLDPKTAMDFLLKMRADYIVDHMRIFRYFRRQSIKRGQKYSLEGSFQTAHYRDYKMLLPREDREALQGITYGDVFTNEANGIIFNTEFGRIVTISQSLNYFLEFSHLALLKFDEEVPPSIRFQALLIAIRVMFQFEAFDFDVDPRGRIPSKIQKRILQPIQSQLQFIVGHEFAHHLLGHLSDNRIHLSLIGDQEKGAKSAEPLPIYSTSEQEELSADLAALMRPRVNDEFRTQMLNGVLIWFGALELYQFARDVIYPQSPWKPRSHPPARDRHLHLVAQVETKFAESVKQISESVINAVESFTEPLAEFLSLHIDDFEKYGSFYLDQPNTAWRGRQLIDRVDYY